MSSHDAAARLSERARAWGVTFGEVRETESSLVAFGVRGGLSVVLKVLRWECDEWHAGAALAAFGGRGTVRILEHVPGAMLLERLSPGTPLADLALAGRDDEATEIVAEVIGRMSPSPARPTGVPTVEAWGRGFARHLATGDMHIARERVEAAQRVFLDLCATQRGTRLLHGDLQHYNVLLDAGRGWLAIDPKGVVGEVEYELGAALRNPIERPGLFVSRGAVERRVRCFEAALGVDAGASWRGRSRRRCSPRSGASRTAPPWARTIPRCAWRTCSSRCWGSRGAGSRSVRAGGRRRRFADPPRGHTCTFDQLPQMLLSGDLSTVISG